MQQDYWILAPAMPARTGRYVALRRGVASGQMPELVGNERAALQKDLRHARPAFFGKCEQGGPPQDVRGRLWPSPVGPKS